MQLVYTLEKCWSTLAVSMKANRGWNKMLMAFLVTFLSHISSPVLSATVSDNVTEPDGYSVEECLDWPFDFSEETPRLTQKLRKSYSTSRSPDKDAFTSIDELFWDKSRRKVSFEFISE